MSQENLGAISEDSASLCKLAVSPKRSLLGHTQSMGIDKGLEESTVLDNWKAEPVWYITHR